MTLLKDDLAELRRLKEEQTKANGYAKKAKAAADQQDEHVRSRMEAEETDGLKSGGWNFVLTRKIKGYVNDEEAYIRWVLENDEGIQSFLASVATQDGVDYTDEVFESLIGAVQYIELLKLKPQQERLNALVNRYLDDGEPMPPGVAHMPADYVSIRSS